MGAAVSAPGAAVPGVVHGGPDGGLPVRFDFSTNANPLGAPRPVRLALTSADRRRYPDPGYGALREALGAFAGVEPGRVLPTAGSSEAIRRLTLAGLVAEGIRCVRVPQPGYGDYAAAARALGLAVVPYGSGGELLAALDGDPAPSLVWLCEPCNPTGESLPPAFWPALQSLAARRGAVLALDRAYEPLRLDGPDPVAPAFAAAAWQLLSPNKALGLTGVRAGWLVAPADARLRPAMASLAPSWVLSAEGVALLQAWTRPDVQQDLAVARERLVRWKARQWAALAALGWVQRSSVAPFWLARPCVETGALPARLDALRARAGVKLRDAASFGMPGWVRLSVQPPGAVRVLVAAWQAQPFARESHCVLT